MKKFKNTESAQLSELPEGPEVEEADEEDRGEEDWHEEGQPQLSPPPLSQLRPGQLAGCARNQVFGEKK